MYRGNVDAMSLRVSLLVSATTLPTVLEPQGKSDLLEGLQDTSEKMRSRFKLEKLKCSNCITILVVIMVIVIFIT